MFNAKKGGNAELDTRSAYGIAVACALFSNRGRTTAEEHAMTPILRGLRLFVAVALASAIGSRPACATMGGGGMKYLIEPTLESAGVASV